MKKLKLTICLLTIGIFTSTIGFSQSQQLNTEPQSDEPVFLLIEDYQPNLRTDNQVRTQITLSELIRGYETGSIEEEKINALIDLNHLTVETINKLGVDKSSKFSKKVYEACATKTKADKKDNKPELK